MPVRLCSTPKCPHPVRPGATRCDKHEREQERNRSRERKGSTRSYDITHRDNDPDWRTRE
jgi:hypothetical protein